jgi:uncharacterized membrane protein YidH (DUF202 family)
MAMRSAARSLALTAVQLVALAVTIVALRGHVPSPSTRHPVVGSSTALVVVYTVAVLAALLSVFAAVRFRRSARRPAPRPEAVPRPTVPWRIVVLAALAVAVLVGGVVLLSAILPHGTISSPDPAMPSRSPTVPATSDVAPAPPDPGRGTDLRPAFAIVLPVLLVLLTAGWLFAGRRRGVDGQRAPVVSDPARDPLSRAAELGLHALSQPALAPGAAIVACYAAMELALAETPDVAPRAADTPAEVLARAVEHGVLQPGAAATLVALFAEARFSRHDMDEDQRDAATAALRLVLEELRSRACVPSP